MEFSSISDLKWKGLLTDETNYDFQSLALKILLSRLKINIRLSKEGEKEKNIEQGIEELKKFFVKLIRLPSIQYDLKLIKGE
ncbi:MAG: hypothetical protein ACFFAS_17600 [Promethearchaeota archaeon]